MEQKHGNQQPLLTNKNQMKNFVVWKMTSIRNWVKNFGNNFKNPTGATGSEKADRICHCIKIEQHIQMKSNSRILGGSSADENNDQSSSEQEDQDSDDNEDNEDINDAIGDGY